MKKIILLIVVSNVLAPPRGYSFLTPSLSIAGIIYWIIKKECPLNNYHLFPEAIDKDVSRIFLKVKRFENTSFIE